MKMKNPFKKTVSISHNGCTCSCHSEEGVVHCVPCCYPYPKKSKVVSSAYGITDVLVKSMVKSTEQK